jgi:hypothetical protein
MPFVEQLIVFEHNEHEVGEARRLASKFGVDLLRISPGVPPEVCATSNFKKCG